MSFKWVKASADSPFIGWATQSQAQHLTLIGSTGSEWVPFDCLGHGAMES